MAQPNVAEVFVDTLREAGIRRIYGVVGDSLNGITEVLRARGDIDWVHVRHEETAAFAAGAEAHLTGRLAVCAGSCGPGNLHLINGLFDAHRSRVPVLAIAAQIPTEEIGSGYFQETRPEALFRDCSVFCESVSDPSPMPRILDLAIRAAVGRRGVAVVVIPGDIALLPAVRTAVSSRASLLPVPPLVRPDDAQLTALAALLEGAGKVTILAGRGCLGAHAGLLALAGRLQAPIVHALGGKEIVEYDNPFDVGMTGLIGFSSGYHAMMECDLLLMLGTDFPYRQFFPEKAKVVQIDLRAEQLGRRTALDMGLVGDVKTTLEALLPHLSQKPDRGHLEACLQHYAEARAGLDELAVPPTDGATAQIHPQQVVHELSRLAADDAVFTVDVGTPTIWAARYLKMNGRRRLIGSFVHGSMAGAMPQAIGAQAAFPGRQVIALAGDGGFTMLMGDLLTLAQEKLPAKIVVFNNGSLGFVEMEMKAAGLLETGVALQNPDFAAMARAAGIHGVRIEHPGQLDAGLRGALAHDGPVVVDVLVARQELSIPPKITAAQAKGFGLYALKAVIDGRGGTLLDLAKTNLLR
ncbi:ubiquinone-dependent pyruvate dehydrogenase [Xylophilus ampelinus]|uniref:Pyruvate dehydrogenase [ubiquinone] n=1 Tax=Xylophilus ampelinus TaxID=54067 RepID=A0A318SE74_9BURK|nr:ubiquinone-dependent pyruvate dehydrogenase [Xylophilus ampelinus]MCS4511391.1 ubiquinone-dependent pyruvate dehydrogenase [Xylophilus ampelinus]PYE75866.1 pyruvate dehydrogenase (quinone)/pyruvate oxidase [Xylophilus ampelinus]